MPEIPSAQPNIPVKTQAKLIRSPFRFVIPLLIILALVFGGYFLVTRVFKINPFGAGTKQNGPLELVYWGLWEPEGVMQEIFNEFHTAHPNITIKYEQHKVVDYRELLQTKLQQKTGPDLFRFHNTWVPMLKNELAVLPDSIMSEEQYTSIFYPIASQTLKTTKGYVGIPLMIDGLGLYYNKRILSANAVSVPKTWDELRRAAVSIRQLKSGTIELAGVALGTTNNVDNWSDILALMMYQNSADPKTPNNQLGQDALKFYTLFNTLDKVWDASLPNSTYAFATEKVAMILAPSWRAHDILALNPKLDFAIAPAPQLPESNITWASFWSEGVSANSSSAKQAAAWELLKYLSEKDTLRKWYAGISSNTRRFGEPFSRVDMADQLTGDPLVGAYISQALTAKSWYLSSFTFDNGLNDGIIKYYQDAINSVNDGRTPAEALTTAEKGITQVLTRYGLAR